MADAFNPRDPGFCKSLSKYLLGVCADVSEIEQTFLKLDLTSKSNIDHEAQISLQKLDHVQQRLLDLSGLFQGITEEFLSNKTLSHKLALAETRALLGQAHVEKSAHSGDIDLF